MSSFTEAQIQAFFDVALKLVTEAGQVICDTISQHKVVSSKSSRTDLVTETDKSLEQMLCQGLRKSFPSHTFIGEETQAAGNGDDVELTDEPTWILDPIDGTMNFVHSNPMCCISLGLVIEKRVVLGLVFAPVLGQMFTAIRGHGAKLNGKPVHVSGCTEISRAMVLMDIHAADGVQSEQLQLGNLSLMIPKIEAFRSIGSAAIDLAMVACGSADAFFHHGGLHCWDVVAGALLVTEAGGYVSDSLPGGAFDAMNRRITACSSKTLSEQLLALGLKTMDKKRDSQQTCGL